MQPNWTEPIPTHYYKPGDILEIPQKTTKEYLRQNGLTHLSDFVEPIQIDIASYPLCRLYYDDKKNTFHPWKTEGIGTWEHRKGEGWFKVKPNHLSYKLADGGFYTDVGRAVKLQLREKEIICG